MGSDRKMVIEKLKTTTRPGTLYKLKAQKRAMSSY